MRMCALHDSMDAKAAPRRILFVINSLAGGGAERVMTTLLRHSARWRERYEMSLALLDNEPQAYEPPEWITVHRLDANFSLVRSLGRLRALVRRTRPDIVLSFLTRANVAARAAVAGTGIPFIISERVNTVAHLPGGLAGLAGRLMVRLTYPRADHVIAVSQGVADGLVDSFGVSRTRISILSNPVDGDAIRARAAAPDGPLPPAPFMVAMGRLVPNKNFALLIDAFAAAAVPERLLIFGDGPEREALARRIATLGMADRILLAGFNDNPFPAIAAARCYILPSNAEGFPNGLVEAMTLGVPVISTDCPSGPSEILGERPPGRTAGLDLAAHGLLVPCDDRDALAEGLRRLQDLALRGHYAEAARARAEDFTVAAAVARYWAVIEGVVHSETADRPSPASEPAQCLGVRP